MYVCSLVNGDKPMKEKNEDETTVNIFMYFLPNLFCVYIYLSWGSNYINALIDLIVLSLDGMMFQWLYIGSITKKTEICKVM